MGTTHNKKQSHRSKPIAPSVAADPPSSNGWKNWLKEADKATHGRQRYRDWFGVSLSAFDVVRYPFLRPEKPPAGDPERTMYEVAEILFERHLKKVESRLALETPEAVADLTAEQRIQLAALAEDCEVGIKCYNLIKPINDAQKKIAREGERRVKMLRRKLMKVLHGLEDLKDYARQMDSQYGFEELPTRVGLCLLALKQFKSAQGLADEFAWCREQGEDPRKSPTLAINPTTRCMVKLYWFFRDGCSLSGDESEVRVAMIRNSFWMELGVEPIDYVPAYNIEENKGCTAVRLAVARYR